MCRDEDVHSVEEIHPVGIFESRGELTDESETEESDNIDEAAATSWPRPPNGSRPQASLSEPTPTLARPSHSEAIRSWALAELSEPTLTPASTSPSEPVRRRTLGFPSSSEPNRAPTLASLADPFPKCTSRIPSETVRACDIGSASEPAQAPLRRPTRTGSSTVICIPFILCPKVRFCNPV